MALKKDSRGPGFKEFTKDVREGDLGAVVLMYGIEEYLIRWAVETVRSRFVSDAASSMDFVILDGSSVDPQDIVSACNTFSMFSERRVVWVRDFRPLKNPKSTAGYGEPGIGILLDYIENPNEGTVVLFTNEDLDGRSRLVKGLKKYGTYYEFGRLSEPELISFAGKRFREAGIAVSPHVMRTLIRATGYDHRESDYRLSRFEQDLQKLIAHSDGVRITEQDVEECVEGDRETFVFALLDGISSGRREQALEILHNKLSEDPYGAIPVTAAIISQVEMMYCVKELLESGTGLQNATSVSKYMKANSYRIEQIIRAVRKTSLPALKDMLIGVYDSHAAMITGTMEPKLALELFIARC